jgi:hypothetical protein
VEDNGKPDAGCRILFAEGIVVEAKMQTRPSAYEQQAGLDLMDISAPVWTNAPGIGDAADLILAITASDAWHRKRPFELLRGGRNNRYRSIQQKSNDSGGETCLKKWMQPIRKPRSGCKTTVVEDNVANPRCCQMLGYLGIHCEWKTSGYEAAGRRHTAAP